MIFPLNLSLDINLFLAVILGMFFGFFLERSGLGDPHKTVGVFYLKDFTVPKVMFTAVVVGAIGIYAFSSLGILDINKVWIIPTFFWPQLLGGLLFGAAFFLTGYCPGTAVAGVGSGRLDALLTLLGVSLGSLIFAIFFPSLEGIKNFSAMGTVTVHGLLGINQWIVITLVIIMAATMFYFIEKFEKKEN